MNTDLNIYILIGCLVFGLIIGSFLNVCIWRVPRKLSVQRPRRSFCPKCEAQLAWYDNLPVFSWLFLLKGRCRYCNEKISGRYPLVEILSAIAAVASYLHFGLTPTFVVLYATTATLIVISFIDYDFKIIPNVISLPGIVIGLLLGVLSYFTGWFGPKVTQGILDSIIGLLIGGGFFLMISEVYFRVTKREGLGGGDIKLMAMLGTILGWKSIFTTIFVGSFFGAIFGIGMILFKGKDGQLEIPFGPYLAIGALIYIFTDLRLFQL